MTTTDLPAPCGNRYRDAVGALLTCDLPTGHPGVHLGHTTPDEYDTWPDTLSAPASGSDISRMTADFAEAGKKMPALYARLTKALGLLPSVSWDDIVQAVAAERVAHEEHRLALSQALGLGTGAPWDAIVDRSQTVTAAATERADLLEEARDALEAAGQNGAHGDDWPAIAPAIRALAADRDRLAAELAAARTGDAPWIRAYREDLTDARQRAKQAEELLRIAEDTSNRSEAARAEAVARAEKAERAANLLAGSHRRAEQAEAALALATAARDEAITRAESAEATLTRVRDALNAARACGTEDGLCPVCADGGGHHAAIERALGDDQPTPAATKPRITTHTYQGTGGPCEVDFYGQTCGAPRDDHGLVPEPEPEQPAEPEPAPEVHVHVTVTPEQVRDAVRHIIRTDQISIRDVIR